MRALCIGGVLTLLAAAIAGCGSGTTATTTSPSSPSSTSSSPSSSASKSSSSASSAKSTTETSSSTSYPAGKEQICQARDQLRTSITTLTDQGLLTAGTTAIKASVDQVQTDFDAVKTAAKQDYHSQVTDMQDALQQLQTAVGNLGSGDAAANLLAVGKAVTATAAAAEDLFTQLKTACGS
jgi:cytoskeletal protein RodZ